MAFFDVNTYSLLNFGMKPVPKTKILRSDTKNILLIRQQ